MNGTELETLANSSRPVWLWDPERRRVVRANRAAATFFGEESLLELVERPFDPREPGVAALGDPALRNAGITVGEESGVVLDLDFPSVADRPLRVSVAPHALPDGRTGLLVVALESLSPERLGQSGLLREVLEAMPLPVVAFDVSARPVYANPAAREMFDDAQLAGMSALFDDVHDALKFLERAARAGLAVTTRRGATRTGERDIRITARLAEGDVPEERIFTVILEDVTERRLLERALERGVVPGSAGTSVTARGSKAQNSDRGRAMLSEADVEAFRRLSGRPAADTRTSERQTSGNSGQGQEARPSLASGDRSQAPETASAETTPVALPEGNGEPLAAPVEKNAEPGSEADGKKPHRVVIRAPKGESGRDSGDGETEERSATSRKEGTDGQPEARQPAERELPVEKPDVEQPAAAGAVETDAGKTEPPRKRKAERPEVPGLVRDVLDHRREPILLHRGETFYYANRKAREVFGFDEDAEEWDGLAAVLLGARDGSDIRLPDVRGNMLPFTLKRDVFPWRDGAVVQSTLYPVEDSGGAAGDGKPDEAPQTMKREETEKQPEGGEPASSRSGRETVVRIGGRAAKSETARDVARKAEPSDTETEQRKRPEISARNADVPVVRISVPAGDGGSEAPAAEREKGAGAPVEEAAAPACETTAIDEELRAILDTATDGIITLNRQGEILSFSAGAEALFGVPLKEVVGKPFRELLDERSQRILDDYLDVLSTGGEMAAIYNEGREVTAKVAGGGTIPLFLTIGRLGRRGDVERPNKAAFCVVVRDITQWKKTESELRQAKERAERSSAQKSRFLAAISHELRTPLNAILGFSDVMRQQRFGEIGNEKYLGYANDIHESGEHLLSLINDLLDLSKIEAGKFELTFEAVDLAAIAGDCLNLMEEQASRGQVLLRRSIPDGLPKVVADVRSMKQIFLNLLSNAVKFTPPGGQVMLSLKLTGSGELVAAVSDTGPGMTEEERELALKPFQRLSSKGREDRPGTGLGLPLTRALAEANKARFELASTPGKGTTARIIFPTPRVLAG